MSYNVDAKIITALVERIAIDEADKRINYNKSLRQEEPFSLV